MSTDTQTSTDHEEEGRDPKQSQGADESEGKNALEWTVVLIGAAIVLFTFGYLTYKIFGEADEPPIVKVTLGEPETRGDLVLVPVEVTNEGGSVAQKATIEVCAGDGECAQLDFPFVPHQAVRKGNLGFRAPLAGPLRSRVMSYRE